jgi:hypothetical protein
MNKKTYKGRIKSISFNRQWCQIQFEGCTGLFNARNRITFHQGDYLFFTVADSRSGQELKFDDKSFVIDEIIHIAKPLTNKEKIILLMQQEEQKVLTNYVTA